MNDELLNRIELNPRVMVLPTITKTNTIGWSASANSMMAR